MADLVRQTPPHVNDPVMQLALNHLYASINAIIDKLLASDPKEKVTEDSGQIRVVREGNSYYLEAKHADGWIRSADSTFTFREK